MGREYYITDSQGLENIVDAIKDVIGREFTEEEREKIRNVLVQSQRDIRDISRASWDIYQNYLFDNGFEIKKKAWWRFWE